MHCRGQAEQPPPLQLVEKVQCRRSVRGIPELSRESGTPHRGGADIGRVEACRWTLELLRTLAATIRADAQSRYDGAEPGWQAGVEWTLLWIETPPAS